MVGLGAGGPGHNSDIVARLLEVLSDVGNVELEATDIGEECRRVVEDLQAFSPFSVKKR